MSVDYSRLFSLEGRHALVVGGGSGIGRESALALAAQGARVTVADVSADAAAETVAGLGSGHAAYTLDVTDAGAVEAAAGELTDVDVLVLSAATNVRKPLVDYSDDEFDKVVRLNLQAPFRMMRLFGAQMAARGGGSIVALSSIRAVVVEPGQGVYSATKAGLVQMVRTLASELGPQGVRVNTIAPGIVDTPLTTQIHQAPEWYQAYADKTVFGRWAQPSEIAGAVVYLASDAASFVTGTQLFVDGGWTAIDGRFTPSFG